MSPTSSFPGEMPHSSSGHTAHSTPPHSLLVRQCMNGFDVTQSGSCHHAHRSARSTRDSLLWFCITEKSGSGGKRRRRTQQQRHHAHRVARMHTGTQQRHPHASLGCYSTALMARTTWCSATLRRTSSSTLNHTSAGPRTHQSARAPSRRHTAATTAGRGQRRWWEEVIRSESILARSTRLRLITSDNLLIEVITPLPRHVATAAPLKHKAAGERQQRSSHNGATCTPSPARTTAHRGTVRRVSEEAKGVKAQHKDAQTSCSS